MAINVRRFRAEEWPVYRDLRLRALAESPNAFGSTLEREAVRPDESWRDRLAEASRSDRELPLVAVADGVPAGLAWGRVDPAESDVVDLFQVWVVPEHRGKGIGRHLLDAVIAWAPSTNARVLRLGVTRGGSAAFRLYQSAGFIDSGEAEPLRPGSTLLSQKMHLLLPPAASKPSR